MPSSFSAPPSQGNQTENSNSKWPSFWGGDQLQLGDIDLTSPPGKLVLATLAAVAEIERDILIERTQAGLRRAKAEGVRLGRPWTTSWDSADAIRVGLADGVTMSQVARDYDVSRATVLRIRESL